MTATKVVNIRRGRCDVYIGRARRGQPPTRWGNPFEIGRRVSRHDLSLLEPFEDQHADLLGATINRKIAIDLYRTYLDARLYRGELRAGDFIEVYGVTVGCFCKPQACHGDLIAEYAEWFHHNPEASTGPARRTNGQREEGA